MLVNLAARAGVFGCHIEEGLELRRIGSGAEGSKEEIEIRDVRHANLHLVVATHHEALLDHLIEDDIFLFEVFFEGALLALRR